MAISRIALYQLPLLFGIGVILTWIILRTFIKFDCWTRSWGARGSASNRVVIDSGAEVHICYDRNKLINYRRYSLPRMIIGIGGAEWALGTGSLKAEAVLPDGSTQYLIFPGVDYVPSCGMILLSTEMLRKNQGIYYCSEKQVLYRKHGARKQVVASLESVYPGTTNDAGTPALKVAWQANDETPAKPVERYSLRSRTTSPLT